MIFKGVAGGILSNLFDVQICGLLKKVLKKFVNILRFKVYKIYRGFFEVLTHVFFLSKQPNFFKELPKLQRNF